jgi:hypothetical protein
MSPILADFAGIACMSRARHRSAGRSLPSGRPYSAARFDIGRASDQAHGADTSNKQLCLRADDVQVALLRHVGSLHVQQFAALRVTLVASEICMAAHIVHDTIAGMTQGCKSLPAHRALPNGALAVWRPQRIDDSSTTRRHATGWRYG